MSTTASSASGGKRVIFTGGSGKAGRHVIPYLLSKRHKILNLDLVPFPNPHANVYTLKTDLTNSVLQLWPLSNGDICYHCATEIGGVLNDGSEQLLV